MPTPAPAPAPSPTPAPSAIDWKTVLSTLISDLPTILALIQTFLAPKSPRAGSPAASPELSPATRAAIATLGAAMLNRGAVALLAYANEQHAASTGPAPASTPAS